MGVGGHAFARRLSCVVRPRWPLARAGESQGRRRRVSMTLYSDVRPERAVGMRYESGSEGCGAGMPLRACRTRVSAVWSGESQA
jgi:hypothetical protein